MRLDGRMMTDSREKVVVAAAIVCGKSIILKNLHCPGSSLLSLRQPLWFFLEVPNNLIKCVNACPVYKLFLSNLTTTTHLSWTRRAVKGNRQTVSLSSSWWRRPASTGHTSHGSDQCDNCIKARHSRTVWSSSSLASSKSAASTNLVVYRDISTLTGDRGRY